MHAPSFSGGRGFECFEWSDAGSPPRQWSNPTVILEEDIIGIIFVSLPLPPTIKPVVIAKLARHL